jgi:hypothetical protein
MQPGRETGEILSTARMAPRAAVLAYGVTQKGIDFVEYQ